MKITRSFLALLVTILLAFGLCACAEEEIRREPREVENKPKATETVDKETLANTEPYTSATEDVNHSDAEDTDISMDIEDLPENTEGTTGNSGTGNEIDFGDLVNQG